MKTFLDNIKDSWQNMKDYRNWIVLTVIIDIIGLIAFAKVYLYTWTKAMVHLETIYGALGEEAVRDAAAMTAASVEFTAQYQALMKYAWILLFSVALIWVISQGINWFVCSKIAMRKKMNMEFFKQHMLKFVVLSVVWLFAFLLITYFSVQLKTSAWSIFGSANSFLIVLLFMLLIYFMFISYSLVPKHGLKEMIQKTFKTGFLSYKKTIPLFLVLMILCSALAFLTIQVFALKDTIGMAFFAVIFLPAVSYVRILYVNALENLKA